MQYYKFCIMSIVCCFGVIINIYNLEKPVSWSDRSTSSHEPSVRLTSVRLTSVRLSSVCRLWRCCTLGRDLNFLAIFLHRLIAQGLGQFVSKFWAKIRRVLRDCVSLIQGVWKIGVFRPIFRFISKTVKDTATHCTYFIFSVIRGMKGEYTKSTCRCISKMLT